MLWLEHIHRLQTKERTWVGFKWEGISCMKGFIVAFIPSSEKHALFWTNCTFPSLNSLFFPPIMCLDVIILAWASAYIAALSCKETPSPPFEQLCHALFVISYLFPVHAIPWDAMKSMITWHLTSAHKAKIGYCAESGPGSVGTGLHTELKNMFFLMTLCVCVSLCASVYVFMTLQSASHQSKGLMQWLEICMLLRISLFISTHNTSKQ